MHPHGTKLSDSAERHIVYRFSYKITKIPAKNTYKNDIFT